MANSELMDKEVRIPDDVMVFLQARLEMGESYEGYKRVKGLLSDPKCTYQQIKRIKHDIESVYRDKDEWNVLLSWCDHVLNELRGRSEQTKKNRSLAGMENVYKSDHYNDNVAPSRPDMYKSDFMEHINRIKQIIIH